MKILGVRVDNLTKEQAKQNISAFLNSSNQQHTVFTPNPEIVVEAQNNHIFHNILNSSSMNLCDGVGLQLVSKFSLSRIPGAGFVHDVCELAEEQGKSVYLLGSGNKETIESSAQNLQNIFPNLQIHGVHPGPRLHIADNKLRILDTDENEKILNHIIDLAPDILFVGFGHNKQEQWIYNHIQQLPSVKVAMAVGGTFDMISGKIKRAPVFIQTIGMEWMWRLLHEPKRIVRIWNATAKFLFFYITKKTSQRHHTMWS